MQSKDFDQAVQDCWHYSCELWQNKTVRETALELQDSYGLDLQLLLTGLWFGSIKQLLEPTQITAMQRVCEPWHQQIVRPLREIRRILGRALACEEGLDHAQKSSSQRLTFRNRIKQLELEAERNQQVMALQALFAAQPANPTGQSGSKAQAMRINCLRIFDHFPTLRNRTAPNDPAIILTWRLLQAIPGRQAFETRGSMTAGPNFAG